MEAPSNSSALCAANVNISAPCLNLPDVNVAADAKVVDLQPISAFLHSARSAVWKKKKDLTCMGFAEMKNERWFSCFLKRSKGKKEKSQQAYNRKSVMSNSRATSKAALVFFQLQKSEVKKEMPGRTMNSFWSFENQFQALLSDCKYTGNMNLKENLVDWPLQSEETCDNSPTLCWGKSRGQCLRIHQRSTMSALCVSAAEHCWDATSAQHTGQHLLGFIQPH